jgi:hypothetical protein
MFVTAAGLGAGWYGVTRYLGPRMTSAVQEEAPAPTPATPRKTARVRKADNAPGPESESSTEPASASASATEDAPSPARIRKSASSAASPAEAETASEPSTPAQTATATEPPREETVREDARTIMEEVQRRAQAKFYQYDGQLQSFDAKNKMTEKRWTFDRSGSNGQSKAVLRFTMPAEVKGVALLIHNHPDRASDQWMWTPALQRDRRIALQDRSTRFFGTDFSFEDLEERDVEQYDYSMLGTETIDGAACWKIETTPKKNRTSQYTRGVAWVRKDNYVVTRLDHFIGDELVKRLTNSEIENIQGVWTPLLLEMADFRRSTRTRLALKQVTYNNPIKERDFTLEAIRH